MPRNANGNANNRFETLPQLLKNYTKEEISQIEKLFSNQNDLIKILKGHKISFVKGRINIKSLFYSNEDESKAEFQWGILKDKQIALDLQLEL